ncbi:MAG: hypothetical protein KatS3mg129_1116 [Leptospiraceae bacterium]|nr:MAG: hypothetical protein KatS3mg129_1116 [Leptospiraceae bacterium]
MDKTKHFDYASVEIKHPEADYKIRQDRKTLHLGEAYLEINGNAYPVENISTFGIAIRIDEKNLFNKNELSASLIVNDKELQKIHLKPVREFIKNGHYYIAFENIDESFDINNLQIIHRLNHTLERNIKLIKPVKINETFKNLTMNLYYWLHKLEQEINHFQIENFYFAKEEIEEYENQIINTTAEYLKIHIMDFLNQLNSAIDILTEKEKKHHYSYFREICGDFFDQS